MSPENIKAMHDFIDVVVSINKGNLMGNGEINAIKSAITSQNPNAFIEGAFYIMENPDRPWDDQQLNALQNAFDQWNRI
jgi:hypothetical protein